MQLAGPGDRRDQDLQDIARAAAGHFDFYICKADDNRRGRDQDEVPRILARALEEAGVSAESIRQIPDEPDAIQAALEMAREDDLVMIFGDAITRCWKQIVHFNGGTEPEEVAMRKPVHTLVNMMESGEPDPFVLEQGMRIVSDERGVRLVSDSDEESD